MKMAHTIKCLLLSILLLVHYKSLATEVLDDSNFERFVKKIEVYQDTNIVLRPRKRRD